MPTHLVEGDLLCLSSVVDCNVNQSTNTFIATPRQASARTPGHRAWQGDKLAITHRCHRVVDAAAHSLGFRGNGWSRARCPGTSGVPVGTAVPCSAPDSRSLYHPGKMQVPFSGCTESFKHSSGLVVSIRHSLTGLTIGLEAHICRWKVLDLICDCKS